MTQSAEEKTKTKRQWTDLAVQQAQEGLWEEALTTNKNILSLFPHEPDALNRLGKAHSELGQYAEAKKAYSLSLKHNPKNIIAKKNLDRLSLIQEVQVPVHVTAERIDPRLFIEETGKTGATDLLNLAPPAILATVGIGDRVQLQRIGHTLLVRNAVGEDIGQVEPRLANRLINFIEGGNRYAAAILAKDNDQVRLILREEYQHPSLFGKVSFPSHGSGDTIRAYIKDSMVRYDRGEDDDELGNDDEYFDGGDEADELAEVDFESTNEPEE